MERGADPNATSPRGWSALHEALDMEEPERMVELLLLAGADPDAHLPHLFVTPLHVAVLSGRRRCVELLLEAGAKPGVRAQLDREVGADGLAIAHTPLSLAASLPGRDEALSALVDAGVPVDAPVVRPREDPRHGWEAPP
jgi:ankyrin repeat protein